MKLTRNRPPAKPAPQDTTESRSAAELLAERDRLTERFALQQSELGGLFYEMAIRDHVQMEILIQKAAELQRVDAELGQIELLLESREPAIAGRCAQCGSVHSRGAAFCAQCAARLPSR
jgi:hypothetical protein